jgi:hypothetical protein
MSIYSVVKNLIKRISKLKKDVVFVGGVSFVYHKIKENTKDIDIVVNNLDGLYELGEIKEFKTKSPMSKSGNRAYTYVDDIQIDIFIEDELPEYVEHNGMKYKTIDSLIKFYKQLIIKTDGFEKNRNELKLELLINKMNKI